MDVACVEAEDAIGPDGDGRGPDRHQRSKVVARRGTALERHVRQHDPSSFVHEDRGASASDLGPNHLESRLLPRVDRVVPRASELSPFDDHPRGTTHVDRGIARELTIDHRQLAVAVGAHRPVRRGPLSRQRDRLTRLARKVALTVPRVRCELRFLIGCLLRGSENHGGFDSSRFVLHAGLRRRYAQDEERRPASHGQDQDGRDADDTRGRAGLSSRRSGGHGGAMGPAQTRRAGLRARARRIPVLAGVPPDPCRCVGCVLRSRCRPWPPYRWAFERAGPSRSSGGRRIAHTRLPWKLLPARSIKRGGGYTFHLATSNGWL